MQAIRKIERADGPTLTIEVPEEFRGRDVEILMLVADRDHPAASTPPELDPRYARFLMPKPPLSEEARKVAERQAAGIPDPAFRFDDPFTPAVSESDFDMDFAEPDSQTP